MQPQVVPPGGDAGIGDRHVGAVAVGVGQRGRQVAVELDLADHQVGAEAKADRVVQPVGDGRLDEDGLQLDVVDQVGARPVGRPLDLVAERRVDADAPGHLVRQPLDVVAVDRRTQRVVGLGLGVGILVLVVGRRFEQEDATDDIGIRGQLGHRPGIEKQRLRALGHRHRGVPHGQRLLALGRGAVATGLRAAGQDDAQQDRCYLLHGF